MMLSYHNELLTSVIIKHPRFALHSSVAWPTLANSSRLCTGLQGSEWPFAGYFPLLPSPWLEADCSADFPGPIKHICLHAVAYHVLHKYQYYAGCCTRQTLKVVPVWQVAEQQNTSKDPWMGARIAKTFSHPLGFWVSSTPRALWTWEPLPMLGLGGHSMPREMKIHASSTYSSNDYSLQQTSHLWCFLSG